MKQKYGLLIATWILWFASILIPLLYSALKSIPRRWMTLLLLVTMLLSLAVLFQWVFLRRSERQHMENFHGEIEAAGMTALQHMTAPVRFSGITRRSACALPPAAMCWDSMCRMSSI